MDWDKTITVLRICLPVFGVIGLGKVLSLTGFMQAPHREFINRLVYYISLPALIFGSMAKQDPSLLANSNLLLASAVPILLTAGIYFVTAKLTGLKGGFAAAFVFGTFWSNSAYMGFPLAREAFGEAGFNTAAIYNALCIPVFLIVAFLLIGFFGAGTEKESFRTRVRRVFLNPFILSILLGAVVAYFISPHRQPDGSYDLPRTMIYAGRILDSFLLMIGGIGLPLALIAIGGVLHMGAFKGRIAALGAVTLGKLVVSPLICFCLFNHWLTDWTSAERGTMVLLHAMPTAVVAYVIACKIGVDEGFVSTLLVVSTVASAITTPLWVYFLL